jgi:DoxX-like family
VGHERAACTVPVRGWSHETDEAVVVETTVQLGYSEGIILGLGIVLLACVLYSIPRTVVLGSILLTGYLGGAVATHVRVEDGPFPVFFPVIMGALLWGGLFFRDRRLRELIPVRTSQCLTTRA